MNSKPRVGSSSRPLSSGTSLTEQELRLTIADDQSTSTRRLSFALEVTDKSFSCEMMFLHAAWPDTSRHIRQRNLKRCLNTFSPWLSPNIPLSSTLPLVQALPFGLLRPLELKLRSDSNLIHLSQPPQLQN